MWWARQEVQPTHPSTVRQLWPMQGLMALVESALAGMVVLVACPYLAQAAGAGALGAILVTAGPVETDLALTVTHPEALGRQVLAERVAEELAAGLWATAIAGGGLVAGLAAGSAFLAKEVMVVAASGHSPKALMAVLALESRR